MNTLINLISSACEQAFEACGYDSKFGKANLSNRPDLCEYQCNGAMGAAKQYKKKPIDIASEIAEKLQNTNGAMFGKVEAVMPGFINLDIAEDYLASYVQKVVEDPELGVEKNEEKTVIVDYGGANVAKPLHVGHLRSAVIGEAIRRMSVRMGNKTIGDVHLGDWGLQMGLIIEELRDRKPELPYFDEAFTGEYPTEAPFTISELEDIYPCASGKAKEDEAFKERAHQATAKLQAGYAPFTALWHHIMNVSLADLKKNYGNLDVHFDLWKGESDAQPYIPGLIQDLEEKKIAYESEGALVVDVTEEGDSKELPPCIIRKSDGAALYATSDLGTIIEREKEYTPDEYIYITDNRQSLHFTQVFRVAKKGNIVPETRILKHIGFGTMNGKDGKPFKTREGGVLRLEVLIKDTADKVYSRIKESRGDEIPEEEARQTAKIIGLAALKYGDLSNQATKDYVFDLDRFTSFEGNTGPYILYTIVRIKSILNKYAEQKNSSEAELEHLTCTGVQGYEFAELAKGSGKNLALLLARYNEVMAQAWADLAPHRLCQYIYELSNAFNSFYHDTKILAEEEEKKQKTYIALLILAKKILEDCIHTLGFSAPDRM